MVNPAAIIGAITSGAGVGSTIAAGPASSSMRESRPYGSVRGALSNRRPYRDPDFGYRDPNSSVPGFRAALDSQLASPETSPFSTPLKFSEFSNE